MKHFHITTLGCKVNQYESAAIAADLTARGAVRSKSDQPVDVVIVNTCTVTHKAAMQSRQAVRKALRTHPHARMVVTGCYAQTEPQVIRQIPGVADVVPQVDKAAIAELIFGKHPLPSKSVLHFEDDTSTTGRPSIPPATIDGGRTRPFLKIQDGCNAMCSYCVVPYARGRSRSMPPGQVLRHLTAFAAAGYREVVLTGIHLGAYGLDLTPQTPLCSLLEQVDAKINIERIRLSSIEPGELNDTILQQVVASPRLCRHFHIPLQSGDNDILKRMQRPYRREDFAALVTRIHDLLPNAAIGADILVGFPGETDAAFANTLALVSNLPITYLHVFPFSPRSGTPAAGYDGQISPPVVKARTAKIRRLGIQKKSKFYKRHLGIITDILVESKRDPSTGFLKGLTSNYIPVLIPGSDSMINTMAKVCIQEVDGAQGVLGRAV